MSVFFCFQSTAGRLFDNGIYSSYIDIRLVLLEMSRRVQIEPSPPPEKTSFKKLSLGREIEEFSAKNKNSSSLIPSAPARNQFIDEATGVMHEWLHESHQ